MQLRSLQISPLTKIPIGMVLEWRAANRRLQILFKKGETFFGYLGGSMIQSNVGHIRNRPTYPSWEPPQVKQLTDLEILTQTTQASFST